MKTKAAFVGAGGATLRHVLAWTLLAGHNAAALVRDPIKLENILSDLGVSKAIQQAQLVVIQGSSRDTNTVRNLLLSDPEVIFSGITSTWRLHYNPFRPIMMNDTTITGDSASAVIQALRDLKSTKSISNSPIYAPISSTGHGSRRDQPLPLIPLYWWLLSVPQADTAVLEKIIQEAAKEKNPSLGGYVMLRPPLLTNGRMKGTNSVRVGWIWGEDMYKESSQKESGIEVGYTISRLDLARWIFEELVEGDVQNWKGKNLTSSSRTSINWRELCQLPYAAGTSRCRTYQRGFPKVVAIDLNRRAVCLEMGADAYIDVTETADVPSEIINITEGGVHGCIMCVPSPKAYADAARYLRTSWVLVCIALSPAPVAVTPTDFVIRGITVMGSSTDNVQDAEEALGFVARGEVRPLYTEYSLDEVAGVLDKLEAGELVEKAVLRMC